MSVATSSRHRELPAYARSGRLAGSSRPDVPYLRLVPPVDEIEPVDGAGSVVNEVEPSNEIDPVGENNPAHHLGPAYRIDPAADPAYRTDLAYRTNPAYCANQAYRINPPHRIDSVYRTDPADQSRRHRVDSARRPIQLTRRGRFVLWALLVGLAVGVVLLLAPASQGAPPAGPLRPVTVHSGDTMWSIATAALPGDAPGVAIERIRILNHLSDNEVYVGEQLLIPAA